jgi:hypothetical protein
MTNSIQIPASISKTRESSALAAIQARETSQVVEGQGAQTVTFRSVEQPSQVLGRCLDSVAIEWLRGAGAGVALRHGSPDGTPIPKSNLTANADNAV